MAKTMARVKDNIVINLVWVDDVTNETVELKNTNDLRINIGDRYDNGHYYRDDVEVLSNRDQIRKDIEDYDDALTEIAMAVNASMVVNDGATSSIEDRKNSILFAIANMVQAAEVITEGGP